MNTQGQKFLANAESSRTRTGQLLEQTINNLTNGVITGPAVAYLAVSQPCVERLAIKMFVLDRMIAYIKDEFQNEMTDEEAVKTAATCWHMAMANAAANVSGFSKHYTTLDCVGPEIFW